MPEKSLDARTAHFHKRGTGIVFPRAARELFGERWNATVLGGEVGRAL